MGKKLYRSATNRFLWGVCGGIGEFFHIDATIVRLIWALFALTGAGIVFYLIAALIIPSEF